MKRVSLKKVLLIGIVGIVVVSSIIGVSSVPHYKTTTLALGTVVKEIDFSTNWYPQGYAKVSLGAAIDIRKIQVKEGEKVPNGKVLAQLVDDTEYNQYKSAQASYNAAIRARNSAKNTPGAPQSQLDTLQGQINSTYYQVKNAEIALNRKKIKSPISGRVVSIQISDYSSPSATANNYIIIANTSDTSFTATVTDRDMSRLKKDMKIEVTTRLSEEPLIGKIAKLGTSPVTAGVDDPTYQITMKLDEYPTNLPFGTKLDGKIIVIDKPSVNVIQYDAITVDSSTEGSVLILQGDKVETVKVGVGAVGDDVVEVTSGISNKDQVVVDQLPDKKSLTLRPWLKKLLGMQ